MPLDTGVYPFKTKPYQHQLDCWRAQRDKPLFALLAEMGTGKSKMLIDTTAWLWDQGKIEALVVLAPKGVYRNWGDEEIPKHLPFHIPYGVGVWDANGKKKDTEDLRKLCGPGSGFLRVLLMNIEALGASDKPRDLLEAFLRKFKSMLVVDESTTIKNPKAERTKALMSVRELAPYRRILSGQPAVNGPLDMYSQCAFLDWRLLGYSSFYAYKAHFAKLVPMRIFAGLNAKTGEKQYRQFKKIAGFQNTDELQAKLKRFAFIVKKEDCLDLPAKLPPVIRAVEMGKKQAKAYEEMKRLAYVEIERAINNTTDQGVSPCVSSAAIVITQMLRLHQILCGFIVTDDKVPVVFDEPNPRLDALVDTLNEASGKVVIWATYKISVRQIAERLSKEYGADSVVTYYGDTSMDERRAAVSSFQDPKSPVRFFVSNRTGARGLTLTASHTAVYYSYDHDLDTHDQSQDRIHRISQNWPCSYVYLKTPGTVEDKILENLRSKQDLSKQITPSNWKTFIQ